MMKYIKRMFFVTTLILLLVSITALSATDATNDTSTRIQQDMVKEVNVEKVSDNTITDTTTKNLKKEEQTTDLYVSDTSGSDDNSGTQTSPYKTIQKALDTTNADSTFNIHIAEGTYKGLGNTNLTVNGNYNINLIGTGINSTILDGEANYNITTNPGYVWESTEIWWPYVNESGNYAMTIEGNGGIITINNLTITNMYCPGGSSISSYPHATIDNYGNLEVDKVEFYSNHAGIGSAIRNNNGGTLIVNNSFFENNTKSSSTGNDGIIYNNGSALVYNSVFDGNYARWSSLLNDKNLTVINTTFKNGVAYDGSSGYRYGTGIGANTGDADFYNPGFFLTYTNVFNCTFINNQECSIYIYDGNLVATGNNFINSTGVNIAGGNAPHDVVYLIDGNNFENMKTSSVTKTLSTPSTTYAIRATGQTTNLTITNNNFTADNATMIDIPTAIIKNNNIYFSNQGIAISLKANDSIVENNTMNGNITLLGYRHTIKNNNITASSEYALTLSTQTRNNTVTDNEIYAKRYVGDYAVLNQQRTNIVANNTPLIPNDYIFVDVSNAYVRTGTMNQTTTIDDALKKVGNNGTICIIPTTTSSKFTTSKEITINQNTVKTGTTEFNIIGFTDNIIMDGNKRSRIFNIHEGFAVNIANINFQNTKNDTGGAIYSQGNLTIENSTFTNSTAEYGGAIFADTDSNITIKNNKFSNITADCETIYLNNTQISNINTNCYENTSVNYELTINSDALNRLSNINESITVSIEDITLTNPNFYDSDITENMTYTIYKNDQKVDTTNSNEYSLTVTSPKTITTYIIPEKFKLPSNTLEFTINYDQPININTNTPEVIAFINAESYLKTELIDEFNDSVECGIVSYYNNETLIGSVEVTDSQTKYITPNLSDGTYNITVKYEDTSGKYASNTNTTLLHITDAVYVSPDVTAPQSGIKTNPTTMKDALTKILDNQKIILLKGNDGTYKIDETIIINKTTVHEDTTTFTIEGEDVILDGQNKTKIMSITNGFTITIQNITYINGNAIRGSAIEAYCNLTLNNTNFYNNYALNDAAITGQPLGRCNLTIIGTNNFINNTNIAIKAAYLNMSGKNLFENNDLALQTSWSLIIDGNNTYKNHRNGVIDAQGYTEIIGTNNFINNTGVNAGIIRSLNYTNITGAKFINNTLKANQTNIISGHPNYSMKDILYVSDCEFINNTLNNSFIIASYYNQNEYNIINNTFINNSATSEIFYFKSTPTVADNTYINSTIKLSGFKIDTTTPIYEPLQVNDEITIQINSYKLVNPSFYDENLLENIDLKYNVFMNDELVNTTESDVSEFNVTLSEVGDVEVYIMPTFSQYKSNTLKFDVEYDHLLNTIIRANNTFATLNEGANIIVNVIDKQGTPVSGGVVSIYDENDNLLGENEVADGIANITTTNLNTLGVIDIKIAYNANDTYNNQTNTSKIIVTYSDVYVSPDVTSPQSGTQDNPTTLLDAFNKISNGGTIHLMEGTTKTYNVDETINITPSTTQQGINSFNITAQTSEVTFNGQEKTVLNIARGMNIQLNNIKFINSTETITNNGTLIINGSNVFDNLNNGRAITSNGTLTINGTNTFQNCGSGNGGAIYSNATLIIIGENTFINNTVNTDTQQTGGGAITAVGKSITIEGNNKFINNSVRGASNAQGGTIRAENTNMTINGENLFQDSKLYATATSNGGTIYINKGNLLINGSNTFSNSYLEVVSGANGGTIYSSNGNLTITGNNVFNGSTSNGNGGTISNAGKLIIEGNNIFNNSVGVTGGIIYTSTGNKTITGNNIFTNAIGQTGAIIYVSGSAYSKCNLTIENAVFQNISNIEGGAINTDYTTITLRNNKFTDITSNYETLNFNNADTKTINNNKFKNCTISVYQPTLTSPQENTTINMDESITLNINVILTHPTNYDTNILDNIEYQIFINGKNQYNTTESEFTFIPEEFGTLTINTYSSIFNNPSNKITINVIKKDIIVEPITATIGQTINITARITVNNETMTDLSKGKITFKVNGKTLKDANGKVIYAKVVNGVATIENYVVPDDWSKDGTTIQAVYSGSVDCDKLTSEKANITITSPEPTITVTPITSDVQTGSTIALKAKVAVGDKAITTGKIVFKINGKTVKDENGKVIYAKVDANGEVSVDYTIPESFKAGTYTIEATFIAPNYDKITSNTTMTVVKS